MLIVDLANGLTQYTQRVCADSRYGAVLILRSDFSGYIYTTHNREVGFGYDTTILFRFQNYEEMLKELKIIALFLYLKDGVSVQLYDDGSGIFFKGNYDRHLAYYSLIHVPSEEYIICEF